LYSRELLTRLQRYYGVVIGRTTLRMELKRLGYVWKRTRYCLKNATWSDSSRLEATSTHWADGRKPGEIELAYVDEAGFASQPPNRSASTQRGETHAVEAKRSPRLKVIDAVLSSWALADGQPLAHGQWTVLRVFDGVDRAGAEAAGGDSSQCLKPHRQSDATLQVTARGKRPAVLLSAALQSRTEPDRNAVEENEVRMATVPILDAAGTRASINQIRAGFGSEHQLTFC
jgi:hypothetical protein